MLLGALGAGAFGAEAWESFKFEPGAQRERLQVEEIVDNEEEKLASGELKEEAGGEVGDETGEEAGEEAGDLTADDIGKYMLTGSALSGFTKILQHPERNEKR